MEKRWSLALRISIVILILLIPFNIFQELFQGITLKIIVFFLEMGKASPIVGKDSVKYSIEIFSSTTIDIVKYCVTSSAYYLLTIFTIITKGIPLLKRIMMFLIGSLLIFLINIARIIALIVILLKDGTEAFEFAHTTFFMAISIIYVIIMWILLSYIFEVKTIPVYSDIKDLTKK